MARKNGPTISQEELYPLPGAAQGARNRRCAPAGFGGGTGIALPARAKACLGSARYTPKKTGTRLIWAASVDLGSFLPADAAAALYHYGERSWRFRIESSDNIEISGLQNVTRSQVIEVMGGDIGRNIFFVPLASGRRSWSKSHGSNPPA